MMNKSTSILAAPYHITEKAAIFTGTHKPCAVQSLFPLTDDFFCDYAHVPNPATFSWSDELSRRIAQFNEFSPAGHGWRIETKIGVRANATNKIKK